MNDAGLSRDHDKAEAEKILQGIEFPQEIVRFSVELGTDSTGDDAMWVKLWVRPDLAFDEEVAKRLNAAAALVQRALQAGQFTHFPYTTLDQAA